MKITIWATTNKVGSKSQKSFEVDEDEWNEMSEEDRENYAMEQLWDIVSWGWEEEKEGKSDLRYA